MALDPPRYIAPIILDAQSGIVSGDWSQWFTALQLRSNSQPLSIGLTATGAPPVLLTGQTAGIVTTSIPLPALAGGAYRINWYLSKTVADGVSSSATVTVTWTEQTSGLTKSLSGAALTLDTTAAVQSTGTPLIMVQQATAITYAVAYASNTPNKMTYTLAIQVEEL